MSKKMIKFGLFLLLLLTNWLPVYADFVISDIQATGNKRISFETIRNYLPIEKGNTLNVKNTQESIKALYKTGFFKSVSFLQMPDKVLLIKVVERPSIAEIKIEGNELIKTEEMEMALETIGVKRGRIFNSTQMDKISLDLKRRYQNQGYYAAEVKIDVTELPRNRVALAIQVEEGEAASIGRITLVGNQAFTDSRLKLQMMLSDTATIGDGNTYAKPKLQSDLETLRSYYMDRGFAEFTIKSSQVSLSLDKTQVYITINMEEGPQYLISKIKFSGETVLQKSELSELLDIQEADVFSRGRVINTMNRLRDRLSEEGYAFVEIDPITDLDKEKHEVSLDFRIEPKDRVYVRRIMINGNTRTHDEVIRREMRQFEAAPYSLSAVKRSSTRINRLGYFQMVNIETKRVSKDQIDLVVNVEEQSTGSFNAGISYSQLDKVGFTAGITERNLLGTGYRMNLSANYTKAQQKLDFVFTNPYFTPEGVSLGGGPYIHRLDSTQLGISDFVVNNRGALLDLSYPLSEISSVSYGVKIDSQELVCDVLFTVCEDFVQKSGSRFDSVKLTMGWTRDTKNAYYFPSEGQVSSLTAEGVTPISGSSMSFYKLYGQQTFFVPISENFTFKLVGNAAYAGSLSKMTEIPFYEHFYAGGIGSVRGYEPNSLGGNYVTATEGSNRPKGGVVKVTSSAAFLFPLPFIEDSSNLRVSLFLDTGGIFANQSSVDASGFRSAYGIGLSWITPVGPLAFSFAHAINPSVEDRPQVFQFSLGVPM